MDSRTILQGTFLLSLFLGGIWLSRQYDLTLSVEPVARSAAASTHAYQPSYARTEGPHLVLLFVGSSSCRWSNDPSLPEVLETLKLHLAEYASLHEMAFRAVGVSVDWATAAGLEHLAGFGEFDEVSVGGNWANTTLLGQVWERGFTGATPAVYVYLRDVALEADSATGALAGMGRSADALILARTGLDEMQRLAELGPERYLANLDIIEPGAAPGDRIEERGS